MGAQLSPLTGDEEEDVDYPPDAQSAQGEQLAHRCPRLTRTGPGLPNKQNCTVHRKPVRWVVDTLHRYPGLAQAEPVQAWPTKQPHVGTVDRNRTVLTSRVSEPACFGAAPGIFLSGAGSGSW